MSTAGDKVYARIPFAYVTHRDRGEVFRLIEARNNGKLEGLRYFLPFNSKEHGEIPCDLCGRFFISTSFLELHKRKKDCNDDSAVPTRLETAELIGADPNKFVTDDAEERQTATNLDNRV